MSNRIGLRLENKNVWERRVALTPSDLGTLVDEGLDVCVQRFKRRAFADELYEQAGAVLTDSVSDCDLVLGIKEMPMEEFREGGAYMFFSHTIKGQPYNMKMLADLVEKKCTLLDYELVTDEQGRRIIFFGRFAGLAGMIDTLWTLGLRLKELGSETPFAALHPAHEYTDLDDAKAHVVSLGARLTKEGVPKSIAPLVIGVTGYGNVSKGAQEIAELLPHVRVAPDDLASFVENNKGMTDKVVIVEYKEQDLVEPVDLTASFDLQHYYSNGAAYKSKFEPHLKLVSVLINGIYWDEQYPKLADSEQLKTLFADGASPRLLTVGDITCDVDGSLACTLRDTGPGDPHYVYNPQTRETPSGVSGPGLAVMAVGNLPCELPREASSTFSEALTPFMLQIAKADLRSTFENTNLPAPIKRSVILWNGEFTPEYEYMKDYLR